MHHLIWDETNSMKVLIDLKDTFHLLQKLNSLNIIKNH